MRYRPNFLCSSCFKAHKAVLRNGKLALVWSADQAAIAKILNQLQNGRYERFKASFKALKEQRPEHIKLTLHDISQVKASLERFVGDGKRFSADDQERIMDFLILWDAHVSGEKSAERAAEKMPQARRQNRWSSFFFRKKLLPSVSPSSAVR